MTRTMTAADLARFRATLRRGRTISRDAAEGLTPSDFRGSRFATYVDDETGQAVTAVRLRDGRLVDPDHGGAHNMVPDALP